MLAPSPCDYTRTSPARAHARLRRLPKEILCELLLAFVEFHSALLSVRNRRSGKTTFAYEFSNPFLRALTTSGRGTGFCQLFISNFWLPFTASGLPYHQCV